MADKSYSYGDVSVRQDLLDQIHDLNITETYVTSNAGNVAVNATYHTWNEDPIEAQTSQSGTIEGADTTYSMGTPSGYANMTQIIEKGVKVTHSNQDSTHAGFSDKWAREKAKKMLEWKNQFELSAVIGTLASGDGSANARKMNGIIRFASTLATQESSATLDSDAYNTYMGNAYDQGADIDTILVGRVLKERISGFTTPNTRNIAAGDKKVINTISVYEGDHGTQTIVKHRYIDSGATSGSHALCGYMSDYVKVGYLTNPGYEDRAQTGGFKAGAIYGEATVQVDNEKSITFIDGLI